MIAKSFLSSVLATLATGVLLFLMMSAIAEAKPARDAGFTGTVVDFVRLIEPKPLELIDPPRPVPPQPPEAPEYRPPLDAFAGGYGIPEVEITEPVLGGPTLSLAYLDGNYLPIIRVEPKYPPRAIRNEIEGYVLMEFTVSPTGRVLDPVVVSAEPVGVFEASAREAALKFRYKPRVENGVPQRVPGVRTVFTFELSGAG